MAKFSDLSVDLLYIISSHCDQDQLRLLSLTSRLFRKISQRYLFRDVQLSHHPTRSRTKLFLRTLQERPDLIVHVRRLELNPMREDARWPTEETNINQITRLLTNLEEFCYRSLDYKVWHYELPFPLKWGHEHAHDQVRKVECHYAISPGVMERCMQLPRLESLYIREVRTAPEPYHRLAAEKSSSVEEIRLGFPLGIQCFSFDAALLRLPCRLRRFHIEIPEGVNTVLDGVRLTSFLEPVRETLEELSITENNGGGIQTWGLPNLSAFTAMKKLSIPLRCFFGSGNIAPGVADRIPPHLSTFTVSLRTMPKESEAELTSQVFSVPMYSLSPAQVNWDETGELYTWIIGVLAPEDPVSTMPDLKTITITGPRCKSLSAGPVSDDPFRDYKGEIELRYARGNCV